MMMNKIKCDRPITSKPTSCRQLHVSLFTIHYFDVNSLLIISYQHKQEDDLFELTSRLECVFLISNNNNSIIHQKLNYEKRNM